MREIYKCKVTALQIHEKISERALEPGRSSFSRLEAITKLLKDFRVLSSF